jgi:hypothetical protein
MKMNIRKESKRIMKNKKKRDYRRNNLLKVREKDRLYKQRRRNQLKA